MAFGVGKKKSWENHKLTQVTNLIMEYGVTSTIIHSGEHLFA